MWIDPDSFATTLLTLFIDTYGFAPGIKDVNEVLQWDPETIRREIEDDFAVKMLPSNFDKLMTAIHIITTNSFYKSLPDFIELVNALAGKGVHYGQFEMCDTVDVAWGLTEGMMLSPPDENDPKPFNDEIVGYIGYICDEEGIITPPDILQIGTRDTNLINKVNYDFSDDTEMFNAIWGEEKSKTEDINNAVKQALKVLILQLQNLPLQHGNGANAAKSMLKTLEKKTHQNSVL